MKRRHFLAASASLLLAHAAHAQRKDRVYRIGFLGTLSPTPEVKSFTTDHIWRALRERGWQEGKNFVVVERWADGKIERLSELAAQLVQAKVDVIVVALPDAALAAKKATTTIPIVVVLSLDPVRIGLIESYARPGGNVTGLSYEAGPTLGDKQLDLLKQAVPGLARVAVLWNADAPTQALWLKDMEPAAKALGLELQPVEARSERDLEAAFQRATEVRAGALVVMPDAMFFFHRKRIAELAVRHRLPSISMLHEYPHLGGLMGYVADIPDSYRRAAPYVDKILRGAKPADLAVEQPAKFNLTINQRTARAIGLPMPQALLLRADKVIE